MSRETLKFDYLTALSEAQKIVRASNLYRPFIDGTPLQNDVAVWMADFAGQHVQAALAASPEVPRESTPTFDAPDPRQAVFMTGWREGFEAGRSSCSRVPNVLDALESYRNIYAAELRKAPQHLERFLESVRAVERAAAPRAQGGEAHGDVEKSRGLAGRQFCGGTGGDGAPDSQPAPSIGNKFAERTAELTAGHSLTPSSETTGGATAFGNSGGSDGRQQAPEAAASAAAAVGDRDPSSVDGGSNGQRAAEATRGDASRATSSSVGAPVREDAPDSDVQRKMRETFSLPRIVEVLRSKARICRRLSETAGDRGAWVGLGDELDDAADMVNLHVPAALSGREEAPDKFSRDRDATCEWNCTKSFPHDGPCGVAQPAAPVVREDEPDFWRCKSCSCLWRDNHNGTVSLASVKQTSCGVCEWQPDACEPLYLAAALSGREEALRTLLATFAAHGVYCAVAGYKEPWRDGDGQRCNCGLAELRAALTLPAPDGKEQQVKRVKVLLNRLMLTATALGTQSQQLNIPAEDRVTDADVDRAEAKVLEAIFPAPVKEQ